MESRIGRHPLATALTTFVFLIGLLAIASYFPKVRAMDLPPLPPRPFRPTAPALRNLRANPFPPVSPPRTGLAAGFVGEEGIPPHPTHSQQERFGLSHDTSHETSDGASENRQPLLMEWQGSRVNRRVVWRNARVGGAEGQPESGGGSGGTVGPEGKVRGNKKESMAREEVAWNEKKWEREKAWRSNERKSVSRAQMERRELLLFDGSRMLPKKRGACMYYYKTGRFTLKYINPRNTTLSPSDAWAPQGKRRVLSGDCRFALNAQCKIVKTFPSGCDDGDRCRKSRCVWYGNRIASPAACFPFPSCFFAPAHCSRSPRVLCAKKRPVNVFHVVDDFGAAGNGIVNDARPITAAFEAACRYAADAAVPAAEKNKAGRHAIVVIPKGKVFKFGSPMVWQGPCGAGNITIRLSGKLVFPLSPLAFRGVPDFILLLDRIQRLRIMGRGSINGMGFVWWDLFNKKQLKWNQKIRPGMLFLHRCTDVQINGITLRNPPMQHLHLYRCSNVRISGVKTRTPADSPNTDSIGIGMSTNVTVEHCTLHAGDDNVAITGGSSNILLRNLVCTAGHGISIGSLGSGGSMACVSDIRVQNVQLAALSNGLRIKTYQGGQGAVWNIHYENVTMQDVTNAIIIDQNYCDRNNVGPEGCTSSSGNAIAIFNVSYRNVTGYCNGSRGIDFSCSPATPCRSISLDSINLKRSLQSTYPSLGSRYRNVYGSSVRVASPRIMGGVGWSTTSIAASKTNNIAAQATKCGVTYPLSTTTGGSGTGTNSTSSSTNSTSSSTNSTSSSNNSTSSGTNSTRGTTTTTTTITSSTNTNSSSNSTAKISQTSGSSSSTSSSGMATAKGLGARLASIRSSKENTGTNGSSAGNGKSGSSGGSKNGSTKSKSGSSKSKSGSSGTSKQSSSGRSKRGSNSDAVSNTERRTAGANSGGSTAAATAAAGGDGEEGRKGVQMKQRWQDGEGNDKP